MSTLLGGCLYLTIKARVRRFAGRDGPITLWPKESMLDGEYGPTIERFR